MGGVQWKNCAVAREERHAEKRRARREERRASECVWFERGIDRESLRERKEECTSRVRAVAVVAVGVMAVVAVAASG